MCSKHILILLASLLFALNAKANVGLPVVIYGFPFVVSFFIFIVLIEVFALKLLVPKASVTINFKWVTLANLATTFIGYPLSAAFTALFPLIGLQIGWLIPFSNLAKMHTYHSIAFAITLIPCFFLSVWVERWIINKWSPLKLSWRQAYTIHGASYTFLLLMCFLQWPVKLLGYGQFFDFLFK